MTGVRVCVDTSIRLLDDLLSTHLTGADIELCGPDDPGLLVRIVTREAEQSPTRIVVILSDRAAGAVRLLVDGARGDRPAIRPTELRNLVIDLARGLAPRS